MSTLWQACGHFLEQANDLADRIEPARYQSPHVNCFGSSIGGHLRHCLEHFDLFRSGLEIGRIDYDARHRGTPEELDPRAAAVRLVDLRDWFSCQDASVDREIEVRVDCGGESEALWTRSTVGRELQFLISHTVHHFAIIGVMCHSQRIELPPEFGVAPSTLKYRSRMAAGV